MHPITFPLRLDDKSSETFNLQNGLLLLLRRQVIRVSDGDRPVHERGVQNEQSQPIYGEFTKKLVALF